MKKALAALAATVVCCLALVAGSAKAITVYDYPYVCYAYQGGQVYVSGDGHTYVCEYVGPVTFTGFAWVPVN